MKNKPFIILSLLFFCIKINAQNITLQSASSKETGTYFQLVKDSVPADTILITRARSKILDYFIENDSTLNFIYDRSGIILYSESHKKNNKWEFVLMYQLGHTGTSENVYDSKQKVAFDFKFKDGQKITYQFDGEEEEIDISQIREIKRKDRKKAQKIYADHLKSKINSEDE
jgi:hypothetical protein